MDIILKGMAIIAGLPIVLAPIVFSLICIYLGVCSVGYSIFSDLSFGQAMYSCQGGLSSVFGVPFP